MARANSSISSRVEFKNTSGLVSTAIFSIPNEARWNRFDFPVSALGPADLSQMKEVILVLEDWRNTSVRRERLYLDDLAFTTDEPATDPSTVGRRCHAGRNFASHFFLFPEVHG